MGFDKKTGVFAKETSGAGSATNTISCGFAPKAVILWATLNTSQDTFLGGLSLSFGFSDGTTQYCAAIAVEDGAATSDANRYHHNAASVVVLNSADGALLIAGSVSFSGNDVVITWTTNTTTAYLIHYLVLGGSDLTNAKVINTFVASTSATAEDKTGFGFNPDFLLFTHDDDDTAAPVGDALGLLHIGAIANKASRDEMMTFIGAEDAAAASSDETHLADTDSLSRKALMGQSLKAGAFLGSGLAAVTFITDGYNANWSAGASAAWHYGVLALKGLQYDITRDLCPTGTGDDSLTGFGFQPEAMLTFMSPVVSGAEAASDLSLGIGAATSNADEHATWVGDNDAADPTQVDQRSTATYMVLKADPGTPTLDTQASLVSFDADGFTQNFATAPGTAHYQGWIAFGPAAAVAGGQPILKRHGGSVWPTGAQRIGKGW